MLQRLVFRLRTASPNAPQLDIAPSSSLCFSSIFIINLPCRILIANIAMNGPAIGINPDTHTVIPINIVNSKNVNIIQGFSFRAFQACSFNFSCI